LGARCAKRLGTTSQRQFNCNPELREWKQPVRSERIRAPRRAANGGWRGGAV